MSRGRQRAAARAAPGSAPTRFGWLLLLLVTTYLVSAFISATWVSVLQIVLFVGVVALAARTGHLPARVIRWLVAVMIGGSVVAVTLAATHQADAGAGVANLWAALILLFAVVLIVRRVLMQESVTLQSIFGAISAYMIIGLMFAALYSAMNKFAGGGFFAHQMTGNLKTFQYFSFTTLTTLGYGDFTAASDSGRAVAVMEALLGQVFLATLVARLVAAFRPQGRAGDRAPARASAGAPRRGRQYPGAGRAARPRARAAGPRSATPRDISSRDRAWPARRSRSRPGR